ncbi:MAG: flagellar brake protein [Methyloprofundus sp.]|nr:flagellar brake protein [Methyloprofundus sp.]
MLALIKKLIPQKTSKKEVTGPIAPHINSNPRFITEPEKILTILNAVTNIPILCTIPTGASDEVYSTQIVELIDRKKLLTFKALDSNEGNQSLKQHKQLKLITHYNNIHISILLDKIVAHKIQHSAYFQAPLPLRIYYPQRRQFIRIDASNHHFTFQGVSERTSATVGGTIENISRRGLAVIIDNTTARTRIGEVLKNCTLTLDEQTKIHFDFTIRHQRPYSQNALVTIGGSFTETFTMEEQLSLDNLLASLERTEAVARNDI